MIVRKKHVVQLQYFLMDTAKRYAATGDEGRVETDEMLASAAALDYALFVATEHGDATIPESAPAGASGRETLSRAAKAALDLCERMLHTKPQTFADFAARHTGDGGIFATLRGLYDDGALASSDLQFRTLTLAHDVATRRRGAS